MQLRWLVILGCLLITACSDTTTQDLSKNQTTQDPVDTKTTDEAQAKPKTDPTTEPKSDTTPESKTDSNSEPQTEPQTEPKTEPQTEPLSKSDAPDQPETESTEDSQSAEERFESAKGKFDAARAEFFELYRAASAADRPKLIDEKLPKPEDYAKEFLDIATKHPEEPAGFNALMWVAENLGPGPERKQAIDTLLSDHIDKEELSGLCQGLAYSMPGPAVADQLNQLIETSPHDSVKAAATFFLANYLRSVSSAKASLKDMDESELDKELVEYVRNFEPQEQLVETLYQSLIDDYPKITLSPRSPKNFKEMAESALFEMNYLSIGKVAPDIEGEDLDGSEFKLSDYRGKVVLLDFWGDW